MTKDKFLLSLKDRLVGLPQEDVEERLHFYSEMIEDRMEEGLSEEEAVSAVGAVDDIAMQFAGDVTPEKQIKTRQKRPLKPWEIILLALGSPIWISLLIAAFAVGLSLYISLWAVIISLWAVFGSLIGCSLGGVAAGGVLACSGNALTGIAMLGGGSVCAGLSVFVFCGCKAATKGTALLSKKMVMRLSEGRKHNV